MRKIGVILAAAALAASLSVTSLAYTSVSPTTDNKRTEEEEGSKNTDRKSPDTGEAPVILGLSTTALLSGAGILVYLRKRA